jgi:hypothetical protein
MVANGTCIPVSSVGTASSHCSFHIPDVHVAPGMVHNLLSIRRFTTDNSCSVEFDPSGLTVRDLASQCPLLRCNSTGPLYTLQFPVSVSPSSPSSAAFAATTSSTTTSDIRCPQAHDEHLCHACQLGRHVRLPF